MIVFCSFLSFVKTILEFRNEKAHEAVNNLKSLKNNFQMVSTHFRSVANFDTDSFKISEIEKIFNAAKEIKERKTL